jgi:hypothetical protein
MVVGLTEMASVTGVADPGVRAKRWEVYRWAKK